MSGGDINPGRVQKDHFSLIIPDRVNGEVHDAYSAIPQQVGQSFGVGGSLHRLLCTEADFLLYLLGPTPPAAVPEGFPQYLSSGKSTAIGGKTVGFDENSGGSHNPGKDGGLIEERTELGGDLAQFFAQLPLVVDVRAGADPLENFSVLRPHGEGANQVPAISCVRGPPNAEFDFVVGPCFNAMLPDLADAGEVIGMDKRGPTSQSGFFPGGAGVIEPALVVVIEIAVGLRRPDDLRDAVGQEAVALFALAFGLQGALEFLFVLLACGDVAGGADDDFDVAVGVQYRLEDVIENPGDAALAGEGYLALDLDLVPHDFLDLVHVHLRMPRRITELVKAFTDDLVERLAVEFEERAVGVEKAPLRIEDIGEVVGRGEDRLVDPGGAGQLAVRGRGVPGRRREVRLEHAGFRNTQPYYRGNATLVQRLKIRSPINLRTKLFRRAEVDGYLELRARSLRPAQAAAGSNHGARRSAWPRLSSDHLRHESGPLAVSRGRPPRTNSGDPSGPHAR